MNIEQIFKYHRPFGTQAERYVLIRESARQLALLITECCPDSRERSIAITNLQQSVMWANAAIAINEVDVSQ
jgi:hypothetical protein